MKGYRNVGQDNWRRTKSITYTRYY
jgi:hypothetical protein